MCDLHNNNKSLMLFPGSFPSSEFPRAPSSEILGYLCQRYHDK
jgi:hypothetical protein